MRRTTDYLPFQVVSIETQVSDTPDDLFIACNSFEERCLGVQRAFNSSYQTRFSCIFRYEPNVDENPQFEKDRTAHFRELYEGLSRHTRQRVIPIFCNRQNVEDGLGQFRQLYNDFLRRHGCGVITVDVTCFTKLYLFELLYFLMEEAQLPHLRVAYNQAQHYGPGLLTSGITKIFHIPHFPGKFLPNRETILIAFLGFETERALGLWEHYEPFRTIVVLADPPLREGYLQRAEKVNSFLLSRPAVMRTTMNPYDPFEVAEKLEQLYQERCTEGGREVYNVGVISLGTKVQSLGLFLFWRKHRNVRISYAFPQRYGTAYEGRRIGENLVFQIPRPN